MFGANINRQPGPMNEDALQMLRDEGVKKYAAVVTADDYPLGKALRIHHRQNEIDPELKLYAAYLQVSNLKLGTHFYIPSEFIREYNSANNKLVVAVSMKDVEEEQWDRAPSFIVGHIDNIEELPE